MEFSFLFSKTTFILLQLNFRLLWSSDIESCIISGIFQIIFSKVEESRIFNKNRLIYLKEVRRNSLDILFDSLILQDFLSISVQSYTIVHIKLV